MNENRYTMAGWLSIANAGLIPLAIILNIVFQVFTTRVLGFHQPTIGPGDFIGIITTLISIYILLKFRSLLHERYNFFDIDGLILASIAWLVISQIGSIALRGLQFIVGSGRDAEIFVAIVAITFLALTMVAAGVINILIAVKMMRIKEQFSDTLKFFIYLTLTAGILEVSVIFSPLSVLLIPVVFITYGLIFFRDHEQVEFV